MKNNKVDVSRARGGGRKTLYLLGGGELEIFTSYPLSFPSLASPPTVFKANIPPQPLLLIRRLTTIPRLFYSRARREERFGGRCPCYLSRGSPACTVVHSVGLQYLHCILYTPV